MRNVPNYVCAPMLDASALPSQELASIAGLIAKAESPVYIHCAQGHGRTGLVSALVLLALGKADNTDAAIEMVQSARPLVRLNVTQRAALLDASSLIQPIVVCSET
ncbi:MAG: tyrosine-protein phosphatase [Planctomycetota bacterium]